MEKFRAKVADPALAERLTARAARAADRSAIRTTREIERAEKEVREAERAQQAERDAAIEAERAKTESGERERALQAKQKAARDARYAARKSRPFFNGATMDVPPWARADAAQESNWLPAPQARFRVRTLIRIKSADCAHP